MRQLIRNVRVLDPDGPIRIADIAIEGSIIAQVGTDLDDRDTEIIDGTGMIAMPGLINAHTHSGQHLDRGVAPNLPLDLWLMLVVYGGPGFSPDDSYTLALAGAVEMLESGCTAVLDHAWLDPDAFAVHADAIMSAYADVGIRAGLAPMVQDLDIFESMSFPEIGVPVPDPLGPELAPEAVLESMHAFLKKWMQRHPRLTPMIGPSAPQRCSDTLMAGLAKLRNDSGALFHTHLLETATQIEATRRRYGRSSVDVLGDLGLLGPWASFAHCVWMDDTEYQAIVDAQATIVHNPISNLRCGSGLLPVADLLGHNCSVALGADGAASNDNQNMFEAMKFATLLPTLYEDHRRWPDAVDIWRMCLQGGAAALGQPLGSLTVGAKADIVLLTSERHGRAERDVLVRSLVMAEHGESVDTVLVDGELVVSSGRVTTIDRHDLTRRSQALQQRILDSPGRHEVLNNSLAALNAVHDLDSTPPHLQRRAVITPAFATGPTPNDHRL